MSQIVGYARVSSVGQSLDIQIAALKAAGCTKIFSEKLSGTTAARPQFQAMRSYVREGDVVVVCKMDRLSRSVQHLLDFIQYMNDQKVHVRILNQNLDTATPTGRMMVTMLAAVAEFENELRRERQVEGIAAAKAKGTKFGRKAKLNPEALATLREMKAERVPVSEIATRFNISVASVYRLAK